MLEMQERERLKHARVPPTLLKEFAPDCGLLAFPWLAATSGHHVARAIGLAQHQDPRTVEHHSSDRRNHDVRHRDGRDVSPNAQSSLRPLHLMVEEGLVAGEQRRKRRRSLGLAQ